MAHSWYDDALWAELLPALVADSVVAAADDDVDQIVSLLQIPAGAMVLDIGCGPGRHSIAFAKRGCRVTGVDRTRKYLDFAREHAPPAVELVHDSMLSFRRPDAFDAAVCLFTSFGYFEDPNDDLRVLENLHASLKPGGRIVIEMMGKEVLARIYDPKDWQRFPDSRLWLRHSEVLPGWERMRVHWIFAGGGRPEREFRFEHRIYSGVELCALLGRAGFAAAAAYGGLDGSPYDLNAKRLVVTGRKPT